MPAFCKRSRQIRASSRVTLPLPRVSTTPSTIRPMMVASVTARAGAVARTTKSRLCRLGRTGARALVRNHSGRRGRRGRGCGGGLLLLCGQPLLGGGAGGARPRGRWCGLAVGVAVAVARVAIGLADLGDVMDDRQRR